MRPGFPLHSDAATERRKYFSFSAVFRFVATLLLSREVTRAWCGEVGTVWGVVSVGSCCWMRTAAEPLDREEEAVLCVLAEN